MKRERGEVGVGWWWRAGMSGRSGPLRSVNTFPRINTSAETGHQGSRLADGERSEMSPSRVQGVCREVRDLVAVMWPYVV